MRRACSLLAVLIVCSACANFGPKENSAEFVAAISAAADPSEIELSRSGVWLPNQFGYNEPGAGSIPSRMPGAFVLTPKTVVFLVWDDGTSAFVPVKRIQRINIERATVDAYAWNRRLVLVTKDGVDSFELLQEDRMSTDAETTERLSKLLNGSIGDRSAVNADFEEEMFSGNGYSEGASYFGDGYSEREKYVLNKSRETLTETGEQLRMLQLLMQYEAFAEGRCEDYFEIESVAKKGDGQSQYVLGDLYKQGYCVRQDDERALYWVKKAAEGGYEEAYFDLGYFLLEGVGDTKNPAAAAAWLEKASNRRIEAYFLLAKIHFRGEGLPQNFAKALDLALDGAAYGDPSAQALAANMRNWSGYDFYDPVDAYKWALIVKSSGKENIIAALEELISELESSLAPERVSKAQNAATNWKPRKLTKDVPFDPTDFDLPVLADGYSNGLSRQQAQDRLKELGFDRDRFVFFKAVAEDNLEVTKLFVRAGASVDTLSPVEWRTPLLHAAAIGSERVAIYLVSAGADINRTNTLHDDTPVLLAISGGHRKIAKFLIDRGASLDHKGIMYNAVEYNDPDLLESLREKGVAIDEAYTAFDDFSLGTPLLHAVAVVEDSEFHCKEKSVAYLLDHGAGINVRDSHGETLIANALKSVTPYKCVELLLKKGASMDSEPGQEPLFLALLAGNTDLINLLLRHDANPNLTFDLNAEQVPFSLNESSKEAVMNGGSLLQVAVAEQHAAIARLLVRNGADPGAKDELGTTPMSVARSNGDDLMVAVLQGDM